MSRIGSEPIVLPQSVTAQVSQNNTVTVEGPRGKMSHVLGSEITAEVKEGQIVLSCKSDQKTHKALYGTSRSLLQNAVIGVSEGHKATLELIGVGYKSSMRGKALDLVLGHSHGILFFPPPEVHVSAAMTRGTNPMVHLESHDKQLLGQIAAKIKSLRKADPYKGKGVYFLGEKVRRKAGKSGK